MENFDIDLPIDDDLIINVLDDDLYNYDLQSFSLVSLQEAAEKTLLKNIKTKILGNSALLESIAKKLGHTDTEYIAKFTKEVD